MYLFRDVLVRGYDEGILFNGCICYTLSRHCKDKVCLIIESITTELNNIIQTLYLWRY